MAHSKSGAHFGAYSTRVWFLRGFKRHHSFGDGIRSVIDERACYIRAQTQHQRVKNVKKKKKEPEQKEKKSNNYTKNVFGLSVSSDNVNTLINITITI